MGCALFFSTPTLFFHDFEIFNYKNINIVGFNNGYFTDSDYVIEKIEETKIMALI